MSTRKNGTMRVTGIVLFTGRQELYENPGACFYILFISFSFDRSSISWYNSNHYGVVTGNVNARSHRTNVKLI